MLLLHPHRVLAPTLLKSSRPNVRWRALLSVFFLLESSSYAGSWLPKVRARDGRTRTEIEIDARQRRYAGYTDNRAKIGKKMWLHVPSSSRPFACQATLPSLYIRSVKVLQIHGNHILALYKGRGVRILDDGHGHTCHSEYCPTIIQIAARVRKSGNLRSERGRAWE